MNWFVSTSSFSHVACRNPQFNELDNSVDFHILLYVIPPIMDYIESLNCEFKAPIIRYVIPHTVYMHRSKRYSGKLHDPNKLIVCVDQVLWTSRIDFWF